MLSSPHQVEHLISDARGGTAHAFTALLHLVLKDTTLLLLLCSAVHTNAQPETNG